jgi:hypothetical protein
MLSWKVLSSTFDCPQAWHGFTSLKLPEVQDACTKFWNFGKFRNSFPNSDHFRSQNRSQICNLVLFTSEVDAESPNALRKNIFKRVHGRFQLDRWLRDHVHLRFATKCQKRSEKCSQNLGTFPNFGKFPNFGNVPKFWEFPKFSERSECKTRISENAKPNANQEFKQCKTMQNKNFRNLTCEKELTCPWGGAAGVDGPR